MNQCKNCKSPNPQGSEFCNKCGKPIIQIRQMETPKNPTSIKPDTKKTSLSWKWIVIIVVVMFAGAFAFQKIEDYRESKRADDLTTVVNIPLLANKSQEQVEKILGKSSPEGKYLRIHYLPKGELKVSYFENEANYLWLVFSKPIRVTV